MKLNMFEKMSDASQGARFEEDILRQMTARYNVKTVAALANFCELVPASSPQVKEAWKMLKEHLEVKGHKSIIKVSGAEAQLIREYVQKASEGIPTGGGSYQDAIIPKGGEVVHEPKFTLCTTKSGEETKIPNYPVAPITADHVRKIGQDQIDAVVCSHFDIVKGEVVIICDVAKKSQIWGTKGLIRVTGLEALKTLVYTALTDAPGWSEIVDERKTIKGKAFFDLWQDAIHSMDDAAWLILTTEYAQACFNGVKVVTKGDKSGYVISGGAEEYVKIMTPAMFPEQKAAITKFAKQKRRYPLIVLENVKAPQVWPASTPTAIGAIKRVKILDALWGGGKRGFGTIAKTVNFGARMNKVWRELNMIAAMVVRATEDLDRQHVEVQSVKEKPLEKKTGNKKQKKREKREDEINSNSSNTESETEEKLKNAVRGIDVKCTSATVVPIITWLEERQDMRVKILVTDDVKNAIYSIPESRKCWMTNVRRPNCILVTNDTAGQLPAFKKTDKGELTSQLNSAYERWKFSATDEKIMTYTTVFHDNFFRDYSVETFGYAHEAKAIISNYGRQGNITSKDWWGKIYCDTELLNAWWHSPVPIYHEEGVQFSLPSSRLHYNDAIGFTYVEITSDRKDNRKEQTIEGVPDDEELGPADENEDFEGEDDLEGIDGLDDLLYEDD